MEHEIYYVIAKDAVEQMAAYCQLHGHAHVTLVTDQNLLPILAERASRALQERQIVTRQIVLNGNPVVPDDRSITRIFSQIDNRETLFLAVGSGTLTDLTRFVAYRAKADFISMPTAPSMDGYASSGSSLTLDGMKQTIISKPPVAIFADLNVLCAAPRDMIASGFGDVIGKYTALADWALGGLLWNDRYVPELAERTRKGLLRVVGLLERLESDWEQAIFALTDSLLDVGICMMLAGNSRPASGAEHSCSHYWEMKLMRQGRPAGFHGTKVAYATTLIAGLYENLRGISQAEARQMLSQALPPTAQDEVERIRAVFGDTADQVIRTQRKFLALTPAEFETLKLGIIENWEQVQAIAAQVPPQSEIRTRLIQAGLPLDPRAIHLSDEDIREALRFGHYLRDPFTVVKLMLMLGIDPAEAALIQI